MSTDNFNTVYNNNYHLFTEYFNYYYTQYYSQFIHYYQYINSHNICNISLSRKTIRKQQTTITQTASISNINQHTSSKHIKLRLKRKKANKLKQALALIQNLHGKSTSPTNKSKCKLTTTKKHHNHLPSIISTNTRSICNKTDLAN